MNHLIIETVSDTSDWLIIIQFSHVLCFITTFKLAVSTLPHHNGFEFFAHVFLVERLNRIIKNTL